jgi:hypothetical protein
MKERKEKEEEKEEKRKKERVKNSYCPELCYITSFNIIHTNLRFT